MHAWVGANRILGLGTKLFREENHKSKMSDHHKSTILVFLESALALTAMTMGFISASGAKIRLFSHNCRPNYVEEG